MQSSSLLSNLSLCWTNTNKPEPISLTSIPKNIPHPHTINYDNPPRKNRNPHKHPPHHHQHHEFKTINGTSISRLFPWPTKGTTSSSAPDAEDAGPDGAGGSRSPSTTSASVSPRPQQSQPSLGGVSTPPPTPIRAPPPPPSTVGGLGPPGER